MKKIDVHEMPPVISDSGKIRMGAFSPAFPPLVHAAPSKINDKGDVRIGAFSPAFPQQRSK